MHFSPRPLRAGVFGSDCMTYVDTINHFWRIRLDLDLNLSDIGLFFAILSEINRKRSKNNDLLLTRVKIGNPKLEILSGLSTRQINRLRNKLKQSELIFFENGKGKGNYATYSLGNQFGNQDTHDQVKHNIVTSVQEHVQEHVQESVQVNVQDNVQRYKSKEKREKNKEVRKEKKEDTNVSSKEKIPYQEILDSYHEICKTLPKVIKLTKDRKAKIKKRWEDFSTLESWRELFAKAEDTAFLHGDNNRGWKGNLDFLIANETNPIKVLEGKYDKEVPNGGYREGVRKTNSQDFKNPAGTTTTDEELKKLLV